MERLRELNETIEANIAALRQRTASLQDLLEVLNRLQALARSQGQDNIVDAINSLREEADAYAAEVERIWQRIASDAIEEGE